MSKIKVLVVDDSPTMRAIISAKIKADRDLEVVGQAADPFEAREAIKALNPDVVTLDVEMPNMNGIEFLERLMRLRPTPVIMVSSLTTKSAEVTIRALEIGAFDCVAKSSDDSDSLDELPYKIKQAASSAAFRARPSSRPAAHEAAREYDWDGSLVAMGASTGGVEALMEVLARFPRNCPPTVVTQHMPPTFTGTFAKRLDQNCPASVAEAWDGAELAPGRILLAPGGDMHLEVVGSTKLHCRLRPGEKVSGHRPSVDSLFLSVAKTGVAAVGVILTGMGSDGANGLLAMRKAGARTIGQDEASSVVYGMPKAAFDRNAVERQLPLGRIGSEILRLTSKSQIEKRA